MSTARVSVLDQWTGMSVPHCCNCLIAALAVMGIHAEPETGLVKLRFPDGTEIEAIVPENKREADKLVVMADSQNPGNAPIFLTGAEWGEHLKRVKADHFNFFGTDRMPATVTESVMRIMELDLSKIVRLLTIRGKLEPVSRRKTAEILYRQFLVLTLLYPNQQLVPSKDVDEYLDIHSGATKEWREDTLWALGWVPDHNPFFGMNDPEAGRLLQERFDYTVALYRHHFGTIIELNQPPVVGRRNPLAVTVQEPVAA